MSWEGSSGLPLPGVSQEVFIYLLFKDQTTCNSLVKFSFVFEKQPIMLSSASHVSSVSLGCCTVLVGADNKSKFGWVTRLWMCLCVDEKKGLRNAKIKIPFGFLGLLDVGVQQVIGRSPLLGLESSKLQRSCWRQGARNWRTCSGFNEGQKQAVKWTGKTGLQIFFHFGWLAQLHNLLLFPQA